MSLKTVKIYSFV